MSQWICLRRKKHKPAWMCTLKSEIRICWCFYVFFDLVVISSVLTMLNVYCSIVDFIERMYFPKCLLTKKKRYTEVPLFKTFFFCDTNLSDSSNLSKSSFANLNLKKLCFKNFGTFVLIFDTCNPLRSSKLY